jgi:hypothetical protein
VAGDAGSKLEDGAGLCGERGRRAKVWCEDELHVVGDGRGSVVGCYPFMHGWMGLSHRRLCKFIDPGHVDDGSAPLPVRELVAVCNHRTGSASPAHACRCVSAPRRRPPERLDRALRVVGVCSGLGPPCGQSARPRRTPADAPQTLPGPADTTVDALAFTVRAGRQSCGLAALRLFSLSGRADLFEWDLHSGVVRVRPTPHHALAASFLSSLLYSYEP